MERSTIIVGDFAPLPSEVATLTLQRGVSAWASWSFHAADAGTEITIGSSAGCDWQIAAPGVPPIKLRFTGEELWVSNGFHAEEICLNGAPLPVGAVQLCHGDRLHMGPARIDVSMALGLGGAETRGSVLEPESRARVTTGYEVEPLPAQPVKTSAGGGAQVAELRVRRGASPRGAWAFSPHEAGKTVTVGASEECDILVVAPGVEEHEFSVLYAGDALLVKAARPGQGPRLNGRRLLGEWVFVRDGDRLDLGTAQLEAYLKAPTQRADEPAPKPVIEAYEVVAEPVVEVMAEPVTEARDDASAPAISTKLEFAAVAAPVRLGTQLGLPRRVAVPTVIVHTDAPDVAVVPERSNERTRSQARERARIELAATQPMFAASRATFQHDESMDRCCVLETEAPSQKTPLTGWKFLAIAAGTYAAYAAWVVLIEQL
jgi:hypothetical protein